MKTLVKENKKLPNNFKKGRKNLLKKAFLQLLKIFPNEKLIRKLSDNFGFFAIETSSFILTAKDYVYNGLVSAHSQAVYHAWIKRKPLLMFIASKNIFLQFDSQTIFDNSYINHRGSIAMLNFKTSLANKTFGGHTTKSLEAWL
jgi:hypothetical protein